MTYARLVTPAHPTDRRSSAANSDALAVPPHDLRRAVANVPGGLNIPANTSHGIAPTQRNKAARKKRDHQQFTKHRTSPVTEMG
jgi:hypothetical protein